MTGRLDALDDALRLGLSLTKLFLTGWPAFGSPAALTSRNRFHDCEPP